MTGWHVYILDCDGRLYTGITTDPDRRLAEHRSGKSRGAKFTRSARRVLMRYSVEVGDRSLASRVEARIKQMNRAQKEELLKAAPVTAVLLDMLGI